MKLLVTGTRRGRPDVSWWLDKFVARRGTPEAIVLGDSFRWCAETGVDGLARMWALRHGLSEITTIEAARADLPSPERFHERDRRMAAHLGPGDFCLAMPDDESRGTWLTARLCEERGATVAVCKLRRLA